MAAAIAERGMGLVFTLEHPLETASAAVQVDLTGVLTEGGIRASTIPGVAHALADVLHPASRLHQRRLQIG
jgi:hypothetical protein